MARKHSNEYKNKSSNVAEMAAQYCTSRTVKGWGGSVFGKIRREARVYGSEVKVKVTVDLYSASS